MYTRRTQGRGFPRQQSPHLRAHVFLSSLFAGNQIRNWQLQQQYMRQRRRARPVLPSLSPRQQQGVGGRPRPGDSHYAERQLISTYPSHYPHEGNFVYRISSPTNSGSGSHGPLPLPLQPHPPPFKHEPRSLSLAMSTADGQVRARVYRAGPLASHVR